MPAIEVTLTTEPLARASSSQRPRASRIGAKKFTWKTCCQSVERRVERAEPRAVRAFGRDAGVVDEGVQASALAVQALPGLLDGAQRYRPGSARSTWRWSSGPISQGQFSGKAWREQVMTRQPAAEKRLTVAWPMPRLAPVRSMIRRVWLDGARASSISGVRRRDPTSLRARGPCAFAQRPLLRVEPRPRPAVAGPGENDAVVQPEGPVVPELDRDRRDAEARPVGRAGHLADGEFGRNEARPPSPARSGSRAGATAGSPRRRSGCRAGRLRNRRRLPRRSTCVTGPRARTWRRRLFQWNTSAAFGLRGELPSLGASALV